MLPRARGVHVLGTGLAGPVAADPRSIPEMVLEAVDKALAESGLGHDDIDAVVTASVDLFDGLTASNIAVTEVVGAVMKPEARISGDGLAAAAHAVCQILAGAYDTVLVVAHAKASMADHQALTRWTFDPIHVQPLGLDDLACAGLQARLIANQDSAAEGRWAKVAAERGRRAGGAAAVLASPLVADPIRQGMCAPLGDAACAVVLGAGSGRKGPCITGLGWDLDPHALGERDLTRWDGLRRALRRATREEASGATGFDLIEPSCRYPHEEDLFRAACGFAPEVPLSPDGGLFRGTAPVVAGLSRLAAAASRMRKDPKIRRALAHGTWGPAGQGQVVALVGAA